jgi:hypothetical protein
MIARIHAHGVQRRKMMRPCHVPLAILLLVPGIGSAAAEPFCRAVLAEMAAVPRMRLEPGGSTMPSMSFTTGPIGPFTTGSLPPVTTGSLPPLTTFSNSHPATATRR